MKDRWAESTEVVWGNKIKGRRTSVRSSFSLLSFWETIELRYLQVMWARNRRQPDCSTLWPSGLKLCLCKGEFHRLKDQFNGCLVLFWLPVWKINSTWLIWTHMWPNNSREDVWRFRKQYASMDSMVATFTNIWWTLRTDCSLSVTLVQCSALALLGTAVVLTDVQGELWCRLPLLLRDN